MVTDKTFQEWQKEIKTILGVYDVAKFRKFYNKWLLKGIYRNSLPANDEVIELTMRQMVIVSTLTTNEQKEEALKWLDERRKKKGKNNGEN